MKKIETIAEYQQLASRTCPDLGSEEENAFHMNSGILTEIGEAVDPIKKHIAYGKPLDLVNVGEEIADCAWYIANKARMFLPTPILQLIWVDKKEFEDGCKDFEETFKSDLTNFTSERHKLRTAANFLHAITSKQDLNGKSIKESVGIPSMIMLKKVSDMLGLDFFQILTNNITKLQVRYPEKFTNEAALNRNLDAERIELEKGEFLGTSEAEVTL